MNASIEAKKAEAVERMKLWGIYPPIIKCFEQEGIVSRALLRWAPAASSKESSLSASENSRKITTRSFIM